MASDSNLLLLSWFWGAQLGGSDSGHSCLGIQMSNKLNVPTGVFTNLSIDQVSIQVDHLGDGQASLPMLPRHMASLDFLMAWWSQQSWTSYNGWLSLG